MRGFSGLLALISMSQCNGSSSSSSSTGDFSCDDYQVMMDVEVQLAATCSTSADCIQVVSGTGCGCATDDLIANGSFDTIYLYDLWDEAEDATCSLDFGTTCDCDPYAAPACVSGECAWQ